MEYLLFSENGGAVEVIVRPAVFTKSYLDLCYAKFNYLCIHILLGGITLSLLFLPDVASIWLVGCVAKPPLNYQRYM